MTGLTPDLAWKMARNWADAWNRRDLDAVMAHYAEDIRVCSPLVVHRLNRADGILCGKDELRNYFALGMKNAALHFTLEDVRLGVNCATILYRREKGIRVSDTVEFNADLYISRMTACYTDEKCDV